MMPEKQAVMCLKGDWSPVGYTDIYDQEKTCINTIIKITAGNKRAKIRKLT